VINLLAGVVSRQYAACFIVHTAIMDEAVSRGGVVDGVVGTVDPVPGNMGNEDEKGDDELGRIGDASILFRERDAGIFVCERVDEPETIFNVAPLKDSTQKKSTWKATLNHVFRHETPKKKKKKKKCGRSRRSQPTAESPYTLTIPSHGPFTRLPPSPHESIFRIAASLLLILSIVAPYILIYLLTGWHQRQATSTQVNFVLHWLILGQIYGLSIAEFERHTARAYWGIILGFVILFYGWAPIGGLIIVAQEMMQFGDCQSLMFK